MNPLFLIPLLLLCWGEAQAAQPAQPAPTSGTHQPLSTPDGSPPPISPDLPKGPDLIAWELLGQVEVIYPPQEKPKQSNTRMQIATPEGWALPKPRFPAAVLALNNQELKVAGFMFPLDVSQEGQKKFLLARMPPTCAFCLPGGPESMVLVEAEKPIRFTMNAIIVKGHFAAMTQDKDGMFYKMTNAHQEKQGN
ncbi:MAG: DUF3299 domain-containing protein [Magnetococcales bacterium]|nr:DUF3299 domain-containing protein [Magnetococcales bacterium]